MLEILKIAFFAKSLYRTIRIWQPVWHSGFKGSISWSDYEKPEVSKNDTIYYFRVMDAGHTWSLSDGSAQRPTRGKKLFFIPRKQYQNILKVARLCSVNLYRIWTKINQANISHRLGNVYKRPPAEYCF